MRLNEVKRPGEVIHYDPSEGIPTPTTMPTLRDDMQSLVSIAHDIRQEVYRTDARLFQERPTAPTGQQEPYSVQDLLYYALEILRDARHVITEVNERLG